MKLNEVEVSTLEDLKENFDVEALADYFVGGQLLKWLEDLNLTDEASKIAELPKDTDEIYEQLYKIFNVKMPEGERKTFAQMNPSDPILKNLLKEIS